VYCLWIPAEYLDEIVSKEDVEPKESVGLDKDINKHSITDKDIKEVLSISTSLLEIPTTVLPSKEDANGVLNIIGNVAEGNLEFMESFSHLSPMRASSLMMFARLRKKAYKSSQFSFKECVLALVI
jgi:hypothetical protein